MTVVRVVYAIDDDDVLSANRAVDDLNKSNQQLEKSTKEVGDASENASKEVDDFSDSAKNAANQVNIFGVGLGDATEKLGAATKSTSLLGTALKALPLLAVASALASVASFLTSTQRGQERLRIATARTTATLAVFRDRVSQVGERLLTTGEGAAKAESGFAKFLKIITITNPVFQGLVTTLGLARKAFPELTKEINEEVETAARLERQLIENEKAQIDLDVARAEANATIEEQKLLAEDLSQTLAVREEAARQALAVETELLDKEVQLARERVAIIERSQQDSENTLEDVRELAEARIELANLEQTSLTRQIELNNKLNTIQNERFAKEVQAAELRVEARDADLDGIETESDKQIEADLRLAEERQRLFIEQEGLRIEEQKREDERRMQRIESEREAANEILAITVGFLSASSDISKGLAIFNALNNTREAVTKALASAPPPFNFILAGLVGARGFAQVAEIASSSKPQVKPPRFAEGVIDLEGPGTSKSDSIPAYLSRGESVMTAEETQDFLPTLKAIRKGDIDPDILNGISQGQPQVIDATKTIEVPRDRISFDEDGFTAKIARGVSQTLIKQNRFSW